MTNIGFVGWFIFWNQTIYFIIEEQTRSWQINIEIAELNIVFILLTVFKIWNQIICAVYSRYRQKSIIL